MELFVSGVKVPRLGSYADRMAREYLIKRASKEVYLNKIIAQIAQNTAGTSKEISQAVTNSWNEYVNHAFFLEDKKQQRENDMQDEYKFWKKIKPKLKISKTGALSVTGLPKV